MRIAPAETSAPAQTGTELAVLPALEAIVPTEFFKPSGSDAILTTLEETVMALRAKLDISTVGGRQAIASLAYRVSRSKTALDKLREDLVRDRKVELKAIDKEGAVVWDRVEALQKKVRAELDEWENADKTRVANHEAALKMIQDATSSPWTSAAEIVERMAYVNQLIDRPWEEFHSRAELLSRNVIMHLMRALDEAKQREAEAVELARLRQEEADRKEAARVQAIADEAAARERKLAEDRAAEIARLAEVERQRVENERHEAEAKAKQAEARRVEAERQAALERERVEREARETEERLQRQIEQERIEAENRRVKEAEYAEQKRVAAEQETERQLKLAEERRRADEQAAIVRAREAEARADREKAAAIQVERDRVAQEARRVAEEAERRAKNRAHQASVNRDILAALALLNIAEETGKIIIAAIAKGAVPHVTINY
jgi:colicin import membrane protein